MAERTKNLVERYPSRKHSSPSEVFDQGYVTVMGTDAPDDGALRALRVCAYDAGYTFHYRGSRWVSVRKDLIRPGSYGGGSTEDVTWIECEIEDFGRVAFLATTPQYAKDYGLDKLLDDLGVKAPLILYGGTKRVQRYDRSSKSKTSDD